LTEKADLADWLKGLDKLLSLLAVRRKGLATRRKGFADLPKGFDCSPKGLDNPAKGFDEMPKELICRKKRFDARFYV
jgi:hypothetical protein